MSLLRLLYVSESLIDAQSSAVAAIAETAKGRNQQCGVTGFLYFDGLSFIQVLEGLPADVNQIYDAICRDPRHENVRCLLREAVDRRLFGDWNMGFHDGTHEPSFTARTLGAPFPQSMTDRDGPRLVRFLRELSLGHPDVSRVLAD